MHILEYAKCKVRMYALGWYLRDNQTPWHFSWLETLLTHYIYWSIYVIVYVHFSYWSFSSVFLVQCVVPCMNSNCSKYMYNTQSDYIINMFLKRHQYFRDLSMAIIKNRHQHLTRYHFPLNFCLFFVNIWTCILNW